ncbi:MAG: cation transporter [Eggerthellaceae bacterium]|jgi:copper chaperone CopZ
MKRAYKLENLGCANCAAKMENTINKMEGVNACSISFMTQKLTIDADAEVFDEVLNNAQASISKIEPDCVIKR